ncbi:MAG TPA: uracil-DNA glycosylase family protein [Bacteroidales bacterium]|nr:uracil-DNA glycosylase family protein [Bacteroidales bacterium]
MNPAEIDNGIYDTDHVELWARWLGNLDAKIMLVGKDFGGLGFLRQFNGCCDPDSKTNKNLITLFSKLSVAIGTPSSPNADAEVFLTNSIFGIIDTKVKGSNKIRTCQTQENAIEFLRPLIDIIKPKIIIAMGGEAYKCVTCAFDIQKDKTLKSALSNSPYKLPGEMLLFPVFHCGGLGLANRSLEKQVNDWVRITDYI